MRIKTITCHDVCNYGASLQAYALQQYLQELSNEVEIIDYLPAYKPPRHAMTNFYNSGNAARVYRIAPWLRLPMAFVQNLDQLKYQRRRKAFAAFKKNYLQVSACVYTCNAEMTEGCPPHPVAQLDADLYIAGSDQIWNPHYGNGTDPAYYCSFVGDSRRCISYAASFGLSVLPDADIPFVKEHLKNFRSLAVREKTGVAIAETLGFKATQVVDPVLLLSREEWQQICAPRAEAADYLLVYDFLQNVPQVEILAKRIARSEGLWIISLNDDKPCRYADKNVNNAGPQEFLSYIRHARHVLCTSFHATAFSVIFGKDFYTFPMKGHKNSSRMTDFLSSVDLASRFVADTLPEEFLPVDYEHVYSLLDEEIRRSKEWLCSEIDRSVESEKTL